MTRRTAGTGLLRPRAPGAGADLRRLRYFKAVAETLHFSRAAETLGVAQPALSRQIRELEHDLGLRLFERDRRRVALTDAGLELLEGVRAMLERFDEASRRARDAQDGRRGVLTVGAVGMSMVGHLPGLVRTFRARYPEVVTEISIFRSAELLEALRRRRVQLAISTGFAPDAILTGEYLWDCVPRVVLPKDHPLAEKAVVRLSELDGATLFLPQRGAHAHHEVMALCREQSFTPGAIREVSPIADLEALLGLVGCGLGVAILPSPLEALRCPTVVFKPIGTEQVYRVAACWRRDEANPLVRRFVECATASARAGS